MTLHVLVADDEQMARKRLQRLLGAMPDVELCGECENGAEVLARVQKGGVDVILLDINMPGLSGVEALNMLPADGPSVIFCTAHPEHALTAFDGGAVDYVLKPVEAGRLHKALERVRARHQPASSSSSKADGGLRKLAVPTRQGVVLVDFEAITHAVHDGVLVTVHTRDTALLTDFTLQELQERLPSDRFHRVHRRALLNLDHVTRLEPVESGGYVARTHKGHAVDVSRAAARDLRRMLGLRKPLDESDDET